MKKCINCKKQTRENDIYCRNCGSIINKNYYYVIVNVVIILSSLGFGLMIIVSILSFIFLKRVTMEPYKIKNPC